MKIRETLNKMVEDKKEELAKKGGGPNPSYQMGAEATIVVRGPDGKVKGEYKANNSVVTL